MRRALWLSTLLIAWYPRSCAEAQIAVDVQLNAEGDRFAQQIGVTPGFGIRGVL
jgi:hypothetical protein